MPKNDVAAERKEQIVRATVECISKHGYHHFSMQDVARAAGVSKGIIHYYFLNKDDLMMSVLDRVAGDIESILVKNMSAMENPIEKLKIFINLSINIVRTTREYYQVNMDFWTQINQKKDVREVISKHYNKFRETGMAVIQDGIAKGVFNKVNPLHFVSYIIAVVDGLSLQLLFDDQLFNYDEMITTARELILKGLVKV